MSFDYNPFKHIEVVKTKDHKWRWYCHSCGAQSDRTWDRFGKIGDIFDNFIAHIKRSHNRTLEDFEGWSAL